MAEVDEKVEVEPAVEEKKEEKDAENERKDNITVAVIGGFQSGKSTLLGRLLYDSGRRTDKQLSELEAIAKKHEKPDSKYAYFMDASRNSRKRGQTIHSHVAAYNTDQYLLSLTDTPGNIDHIRATVDDLCYSDGIICVVSAAADDFEKSMETGNYPDSKYCGVARTMLRVAHCVGCDPIVIIVNKMDHKSVEWSQQRFNEIRESLRVSLTEMGYDINSVIFIPTAGLSGDNVVNKSERAKWYTGFEATLPDTTIAKGFTLADALPQIFIPPFRDIDTPIMLPVAKRIKVPNVGDVIMGTLVSGAICKQSQLHYYTKDGDWQTVDVKSLQTHNMDRDEAYAGDYMGVCTDLSKIAKSKQLKPGNILIHKELKETFFKPIEQFTAWVIAMSDIDKFSMKKKENNNGGHILQIFCGGQRSVCEIVDVKWKIKVENNRVVSSKKGNDIDKIENSEHCEIILKPKKKPFFVTEYKTCKHFGRFLTVERKCVTLIGKVTKIEYAE